VLEYVGPIVKVTLLVGGGWIALLGLLQVGMNLYGLWSSNGGVPAREYKLSIAEGGMVSLAGGLMLAAGVGL